MAAATDHPNVGALRTMMANWNAGDLPAVRDFFTKDCTLSMGGSMSLAGTYYGRDELFALMQRSMAATGGSVRFGEEVDVLADDQHGVVVVNVTGLHQGRTAQVPLAIGFTFEGAELGPEHVRCTRMWGIPSDRDLWDAYFTG